LKQKISRIYIMANAWIEHVKKTKEMYPELMMTGGLKAVIMKAKDTYKKNKQAGGMGKPMGASAEGMVENGDAVVGGRDARSPVEGGSEVETEVRSDVHTMGGGKKRKGKKGGKSVKKRNTGKKGKKGKKGGKSVKSVKSVKRKTSKKSRKSRK
jgi:hypothetical protein